MFLVFHEKQKKISSTYIDMCFGGLMQFNHDDHNEMLYEESLCGTHILTIMKSQLFRTKATFGNQQ